MRVVIKNTYDEMSKEAGLIVKEQLLKKRNLVLGLATGSTPIGLYKEMIRMHKEEGLDFSKVVTFNLDEYYGLGHDHPQGYYYFMYQNLFKDLNINLKNVHVPSGTVPLDEVDRFCEWYEKEMKKVGGIDLQVLGIGRDGHIGFNEPGSSLASRTRIKTLTEETLQDNTRFFKSMDEVPKYAITMGVGTVMDAKMCILMANGANKAEVFAKAVEGPVTSQVTASVLQFHKNTVAIVEKEASTKLQRSAYYNFVEQATKKLYAK